MQDIIDIINRYFDEGLPQNEEEILFKELSDSQEVRNIFNQHLKLNITTFRDISNITPPIETTEEIFKTLGFSIPNNVYTHSKIKSGAIKIGVSLLILFFASLLSVTTIGISELIVGNKITAEKMLKNISKKTNNSMKYLFNYSNNIKNNDDIKINDNNENDLVGLTYKQKAQNLLKNIYGKNIDNLNMKKSEFNDFNNVNSEYDNLNNNFSDNNVNNINNNSNNTLFELDNMLSASLKNDYDILKNNYNNLNNSSLNSSLLTPNENSNNKINLNNIYIKQKPTYIFLLNKAITQNSTLKNIEANNAFWNNLDFNLLYNINNYHSVGIIIGWKDFAQTFNRTIGNHKFKQQQIPMLFYGSLLYSYDFSNILSLNNFTPYLQASLGGTSIGPILGINLGTNVDIYRNFGLSLTSEYNILFYNVENTIYNSDKLGLKFGIFYGF